MEKAGYILVTDSNCSPLRPPSITVSTSSIFPCIYLRIQHRSALSLISFDGFLPFQGSSCGEGPGRARGRLCLPRRMDPLSRAGTGTGAPWAAPCSLIWKNESLSVQLGREMGFNVTLLLLPIAMGGLGGHQQAGPGARGPEGVVGGHSLPGGQGSRANSSYPSHHPSPSIYRRLCSRHSADCQALTTTLLSITKNRRMWSLHSSS